MEKWRASVGDQLWRKVVFVLNRGGRYQDFAKAYPGELVANKYGKLLGVYQEKTATSTNTMTGKKCAGYATYIPPGLSSTGEPIVDAATTSTSSRTRRSRWRRRAASATTG